MNELETIKWYEDLIAQTNDVFPECSEALQAELIEQKKAAEVAIEALKQPEIVRCRECKYSIYPFQLCKLWKRNANPDDFCSYGERKDGEKHDRPNN